MLFIKCIRKTSNKKMPIKRFYIRRYFSFLWNSDFTNRLRIIFTIFTYLPRKRIKDYFPDRLNGNFAVEIKRIWIPILVGFLLLILDISINSLSMTFRSPSNDFPVWEFLNEKLNKVPLTQFVSHLAKIWKNRFHIFFFSKALPRIELLCRLSKQWSDHFWE